MNDLQSEVGRGAYVEPSKLTVAEDLAEWLDISRARLRPGSHDTCAIHVNRYIVPRLGDLRLQALSPRRITQFYGELARNGRLRGDGGLGDKPSTTSTPPCRGRSRRQWLTGSCRPTRRPGRISSPSHPSSAPGQPTNSRRFSRSSQATGSRRCGGCSR